MNFAFFLGSTTSYHGFFHFFVSITRILFVIIFLVLVFMDLRFFHFESSSIVFSGFATFFVVGMDYKLVTKFKLIFVY